jgi:uncharacterized protein (DUF697 family)
MEQESTSSMNSQKDEAVAAESTTASESAEAEMTPEERQEMATSLVDRFAVWTGVAGFIPVPVVDVVCVGGLQLQMLRRLSQIYNVPFSENSGKAVLASLAGSMIPASSGLGAASVLKAVPVVGTIASGFVMPLLSSGATYAIGKAFIQHFASGGTLLDFNPPDYREFLRAQREMWDSRRKHSKPGAAPAEPSSSGLSETTTGTAATGS